MANTKLNIYEIVLQEVCEKFNGAQEYIKKRIQELCNEKKIISRRGNLLKSYKHHFECSFISLISFAFCIKLIFFCVMFALDAEFRSERCNFNDKKYIYIKSRISSKTIANGKQNENTDIEEMANNCTKSKEDAAKVIHEFEEIIKNKKSDIVWLIKVKYFRSLNLKSDSLTIWLPTSKKANQRQCLKLICAN